MNSGKAALVSGGMLARVRIVALLLTLLAAGALFVRWSLARAGAELRAGLLQQARLVAHTVDSGQVGALSGTAEDLESPGYLKLKEHLAAVRSAYRQCRFVYLMGRRADGTVFFFADSEPAESDDYSPPGQIYDEVPPEYRRVFETGAEAVAGPVADRWGTWTSALVPIMDRQTGALAAVLGMDIDASDWRLEVGARAAVPLGLMLALLIVAVAALFLRRRVNNQPAPIMRRLMPPLSVMVFALLAGVEALFYLQHQQRLDAELAADIRNVSGDLRAALDQESAGMAATLCLIASEPGLPAALREGDAGRLLAAWRPVFESLRREGGLTHLAFFDTNRVCLLRVHDPGRRGDLIDRFTAVEASRIGRAVSGMELGELGTFTLRVVRPVFEGAAVVGYAELGKEVDELLRNLNTRSPVEMAVVVRKDLLNRQAWSDGMRMLGKEADWDRLPRSVVIYASPGRLPDAFESWADGAAAEHASGVTYKAVANDGIAWRASATHLWDAAGRDVGALLAMRDCTAAEAAFSRLQVLFRTAGGVLLFLALSFMYVLLRRTDAGIRAQQAGLRDSEAKHRLLFESASDAIFIHDNQGRILAANPEACRRLGYTHPEMLSLSAGQVFPPGQTPAGRAAGPGEGELHTYEAVMQCKDAALVPAEVNARHITWDGSAAVMLTCRDIAERKRVQEELRWMALTLETAPNAITVEDFDGHIFYANRSAFEMHGYTRDEFLALTLRQLEEPGEEWVRAARMRELSGRGEAFYEVVRLRKDGTALPLDVRAKVTTWHGREAILSVATDITRRREMEAEAVRYQQRLRELAERLASAEDEDRWRISRYIHDTIIQNLSLSSIRLGSAAKRMSVSGLSTEADALRQVKELLGKAIDECRLVMSDLTPSLLHELGLIPALKEFALHVEATHKTRLIVDEDGREEPLSLPLRGMLFDFVRELTMNAIKHAGPCEIHVAVSGRDGELAVCVSDDGKGFDSNAAAAQPSRRGGFGLFSIRRRLEGLGGRLEIESAPGKGTKVTITLPLTGGGTK